MTAETVSFQAETKELLNLVIHSLYKHKEIFLRELISNASDALDKLRHEALTDSSLMEEDEHLAIRLEPDEDERVLRVIDNGIGMSRDEVVENIGTIARSGTRRFLDALQEKGGGEGPSSLPSFIGQFGVGFYSAFMVAEEVVLETRRAGEEGGTRWTSRGEGEYTVEDVDRAERGTSITLRLRRPEDDDEAPMDFTKEWVLRDVVKRYSDFVEWPIEMEVTREAGEGDEKETVVETAVLNSRRPLWTRPKSEIEDREYAEFYKHITHDWNDPLETIHYKAEGALEYTALLYLPRMRPLDLFDPGRPGARLHLYVRRVFILDDCEALLPTWLRFVRGVVDSSDLPLNVSRETLQDHRKVAQIQKGLTKKLLDTLRSLQKDRREDYADLWRAFGSVLKEGAYSDDAHREALAELMLVHSSKEDEPTTLAEYVERMPVKQKEIWVLPAADLDAAKRSPHLETFRDHDTEVLFFVDPVDEFVLQRLTEYDGRPIRRVDTGELDLDEADEAAKAERDEETKALEPLLELVRKELADEIGEVRFSQRLKESPAVLVSSGPGFSPQVERMLRESGQFVPETKRVLELNPSHPLVGRLRDLSAADATFARFGDFCALLLGQALLAEGSPLPDPGRFTRLVSELMVGGDS